MTQALLASRVVLIGMALFLVFHGVQLYRSSHFLQAELMDGGLVVALGCLLALLALGKRTALAAIVAIGCFWAAEGAAYVILSVTSPALRYDVQGQGWWRIGCGELGYCLAPSTSTRQQAKLGNEVVFDMTVITDPYGRRSVAIAPSTVRERFIALWGDSFVFGVGVNEEDTLPHWIGRYACRHMPYNFGVGGFGTNNVLAQLRAPGWQDTIGEGSGIGIYVFLDLHVGRNLGDAVTLTWGRTMPRYRVSQDGSVSYAGSFEQTEPLRVAFWNLVYSRALGRLLVETIGPSLLGEKDFALTLALIKESARLFWSRFPDSEFVVLLYPHHQQRWGARLKEALAGTPIKVLDYSQLLSLFDPGMRVPIDGHPSGTAHRLVARRLVEDLGIACPALHVSQ